MHVGKTLTYSEQDGKREESFSRAIKAIALVVRSKVWCLIATSMTSTASDSVTCLGKKNWLKTFQIVLGDAEL